MKIPSIIKYVIKERHMVLGIFSAILSIICIVDISAMTSSIWVRSLVILIVFIISFIISALKVFFTKRISIRLTTDQKIDVLFGDLFAQTNIIVVPVNRYFDTLVDDILIASYSIHGQFIKNVYGGNVSELDRQITASLEKQGCRPVEIATYKDGKSEAYQIGSIAEVSKDAKIYYLLALTEFDENNEARCPLNQYYEAVIALLIYIKQHSQGRPISMPLIGGRFARLGKSKADILGNLVSICKMFDGHITSDMQIVLDTHDRDCISLYDYK